MVKLVVTCLTVLVASAQIFAMTVTCLNKEIAVNPKSGLVTISADGETLAEVRHTYPVKVKATGKMWWPGLHNPKLTAEGDKAIFDEDISNDGKTWRQYHVEMEEVEKGLLKITTKALYCPYTNLYETVPGENANVILDWKVARGSTWTKTNETVTLYANDITRSLKIIGRKTDGVKTLDVLDLDHARTVVVTGIDKTIYIDIREGVKREKSADTRGGVDFYRVEKLHLPDFSCGNLIYNPSFEAGLKGWYSRFQGYTFNPERYTKPWYSLDRTDAKFGQNSLKLFARHSTGRQEDFRELKEGVSVGTMPVAVDAGRYRFSVWAKGSRAKCWLKGWFAGYRFSSSWLPIADGATLVTEVTEGKWTKYETEFELKNPDMLTMHFNASCPEGEGFVSIDGAQLVPVEGEGGREMVEGGRLEGEGDGELLEPVAMAELVTADPENLLEEGTAYEAKLLVYSQARNGGKVMLTVSDWQGRRISGEELQFSCDANGSAVIPLPSLDTLSRGLYILKYEFDVAEGKAFQYDRLAIIHSPGNKYRWSNMFGSIYANEPCMGTFPAKAARYVRTGIDNVYHVGRAKKYHDEYTKRGIYNAVGHFITEYEEGWGIGEEGETPYIRNATAEGVPLDDAYLARFKEACRKHATANSHILEWEFSNEFYARKGRSTLPHADNPELAPAEWALYMKAYIEGVHEGNPKAKAYSDAPYNMSDGGCEELAKILRACAKIGCYFDGIGAHIYRFSPESPDLDSHYERMKKLLADIGYPEDTPFHHGEGMHWGPYDIPAWGLECSSWAHTPKTWNANMTLSYDVGISEKKSAAWRMRTWFVGLKNARRCRQMNSSNINNFGLDLLFTPRLSQLVPTTLANILGEADFVEDIRFAPFVRVFVFKDPMNRPVAAVWCHKEDVDVGLTNAPEAVAEFDDSIERVRDMMDMDVTDRFAVDADGKVKFSVESSPKFFIGEPGTMDKFLSAFRNARIVGGDLGSRFKASVNPVAPDMAKVSLEDFVTRAVSNYTVKTSAALSYDGQTKVEFAKEKLGYTGFLAKQVDDSAAIDSLDWKTIPRQKLPNRLGNPVDSFDAEYRIAWNRRGIFIEIDVKDAKFSHYPFKPDANRWDNDCAQVYFDTFANARSNQSKGYDQDDYAYILVPEPNGSKARVWRERVADMQLVKGTESPLPNRYATDDHPIPIDFAKTEDGVRYRVFFPEEAVLPAKLEKGSVIGVGIAVSDANDDSITTWLKRREGWLTNTIENGDCYNNPHLYPAVLLW